MALFSISDLHLSFFHTKPMDIFGDIWKNHPEQIKNNWLANITFEDFVLMPGDLSWAKTEEEVAPDLTFIDSLPGKKIVLTGNHDYWWGSTNRLNETFESITFLKNNHYMFSNKLAICGSRGWLCPNDTMFSEHDEKIYNRELNRLKLSLDGAMQKGCEKIIVMLHFPPTNDKKEMSGFTSLIKQYPVTQVIYGHLHGKHSFNNSISGVHEGIVYQLVSADFLQFKPICIQQHLDI